MIIIQTDTKMGLDTSHNAWHGPYSSFGRWRDWIAKNKGFDLREMIGFGGSKEWTEEMKSDNLYPLLNHSDCDGELTPIECAKVYLGLKELIPIISQDKQPEYWFVDCVEEFMAGCLEAFIKNESIDFH